MAVWRWVLALLFLLSLIGLGLPAKAYLKAGPIGYGHWLVTLASPPLDNFTVPAAAYSMRKLKSSYSGPGIRLRRASDNAEADIGFLSFTGFTGAPIDVAAAQAHCAATTCVVHTWYDQSGNARHVGNSTAVNQPTFEFNCLGGHPCNTAAGAPKVLYTAASQTPVMPATVSAVGRLLSGSPECMFGKQIGSNRFFANSSDAKWYLTNESQFPNGAAANGAWHAGIGVMNGASSVVRIDATETTGTITGSTTAGLYIPIESSGAVCNTVENILWNGYALTAGERAALTANQQSFWGF